MLAVLGLSYPMCRLKTKVTDTSAIYLSIYDNCSFFDSKICSWSETIGRM